MKNSRILLMTIGMYLLMCYSTLLATNKPQVTFVEHVQRGAPHVS